MFKHSLGRIVICILLVGLVGFQFAHVATVSAAEKSVYISTQKFEHGSMIWRKDNGDIWVLLDAGSRAYLFTGAMYSGLAENATVIPPVGKVKPINGFGKVWANFNYIHAALGWAILPEIGYQAELNYNTGYINFPRLDDQVTLISQQQGVYSWRLESAMATNSTTTYAAFQEFENGYLVWRADTQQVLIFYSKQGSTNFDAFAVDNYGKYPDNPVTATPPAGRIKPVNAFGRVWGYLWTHNDQRLGWAVGPEQGYTATAATLPRDGDSWTVRYSITFPNGHRAVTFIGELVVYWQLE